MTNEHIARKRQIGLGLETTPGTGVSAVVWLPLMSPDFKPVSDKAVDNSAYGNIDEVRDQETVQNRTEIALSGILRDDWLGYLLKGVYGTATPCVRGDLGSVSGTFVEGEVVTGGTSAATGTVKRLDGTDDEMWVEVLTGTFTSAETITGGTSAATGTFTYDTALRDHLFERLNTNNHPTFTIYQEDDVATIRATYCMIDTFDVEIAVGDFAKFNMTMKGKKPASSSDTPVYTEENGFLAKHGSVKFAATTSALKVASAEELSRVKLSFQKNLATYQKLGSDDLTSIHNQQFKVMGDFDGLFTSETLRDYQINSTKRAMRVELTNTGVTIGSADNPYLMFEMARCSFQDWSQSSDNDALVNQTLGFTAEFSTDDSYTSICVLRNENTVGY
jgi:hypothetical protein